MPPGESPRMHLESAFRKFFREPSCGFPAINQENIQEILYDQCSKQEYLFAGYPFEASKDVRHKNKTSPPDPVRLETEIGNDKP